MESDIRWLLLTQLALIYNAATIFNPRSGNDLTLAALNRNQMHACALDIQPLAMQRRAGGAQAPCQHRPHQRRLMAQRLLQPRLQQLHTLRLPLQRTQQRRQAGAVGVVECAPRGMVALGVAEIGALQSGNTEWKVKNRANQQGRLGKAACHLNAGKQYCKNAQGRCPTHPAARALGQHVTQRRLAGPAVGTATRRSADRRKWRSCPRCRPCSRRCVWCSRLCCCRMLRCFILLLPELLLLLLLL